MRIKPEFGPGQQDFITGVENGIPLFGISAPIGEPATVESEIIIPRPISFSKIENQIHINYGVEPKGLIGEGLVKGTAIDDFLVLVNFIYRYRSKFSLPDNDEWTAEEAFWQFIPTGFPNVKEKMFSLLYKHRPNFLRVFDKKEIRKRLVPLWIDIAKASGIDSLSFQSTMEKENGYFVESHKTASSEGIMDIAKRIINERFYSLIDDDQDYTYYARPDFFIAYDLDGKTYHIQIQPDYVKNLRTGSESVRKRIAAGEKLNKRIVAQRIIGDFKDSEVADLRSTTGPRAESRRLFTWLMLEAGAKGRMTQAVWTRLSGGQAQKAIIIPLDAKAMISPRRVDTRLTVLRADRENMDFRMQHPTRESERKLKESLDEILRAVG